MIEYTPFIERRERIKAFRFTKPEQAQDIASVFGSWSFELRTSDDTHFELDIAVKDGPETYTQRVNFGDWIIQPPWNHKPRVIPNNEFYQAWEEDK